MIAAARFRPDIQGLRALAVLTVVAYHAGLPLPGGFVGVDLFFVISGFVITRLLWRELGAGDRLSLAAFYARRVRRLLPALALVLLVVAVASLALQNPLGSQQLTAKTGAGAAVFVANAVLFALTGGYFDLPTTDNPLLHTWTLSVEEQFYVFFPLLLIVIWRCRRVLQTERAKQRLVVVTLAAVVLLSLGLCLFLTWAPGRPFGALPDNRRFAFFGSPTRAWEFAAGSLLAVYEPALERLRPALAAVTGVVGLAAYGIACVVITDDTAFPGAAAVLPVTGAVLLIAAGTISATPTTRLLSTPLLGWIGDRSYGWYLWHWPAIVFARVLWPTTGTWLLVLAAALSLVPTALSYRYVENPVRRSPGLRGRRVLQLAVVATLVPALAFAALLAVAEHPTGALRALSEQQADHLDDTRGCQNNLPGTSTTEHDCTWSSPHSRGVVLLIGDSNAGHFIEPVIAAARQRSLSVTLATFGGCPFADLATHKKEAFDADGCARFVRAWESEVQRARPALVILANSSSEYVQPDNDLSFTSLHEGTSPPPADREAAWEGGVRRLLAPWTASGVRALIVHTVPHFNDRTVPGFTGFDARTCPSYRIVRGTCGVSMQRSRVDADRAAARRAESTAAAATGATTLDLDDDICPTDTCTTNDGDRWLYKNATHLTVPFALTLTDRFLSRLP